MISSTNLPLNNQVRPVVLKFGGAALEDPHSLLTLLKHLKDFCSARPFVMVHGGGAVVDNWLRQLDFKSIKIAGQRVTPKVQIPFITGALSGFTNHVFVGTAQQAGYFAVGFSLADGIALPLKHDVEKGQVGFPDWEAIQQMSARKTEPSTFLNPSKNYKELLMTSLAQGWLPVLSSIGQLSTGELVNVNADYAAAAVAYLLDAELILLSDVPAILDVENKPMHQISLTEGEQLLAEPFIQGGMRVKLASALEVVKRSRRTTAIASWQAPADVIALLQNEQQPVGTRITFTE